MIATVSTIKDTLPNVQRFVRGNLAGGADHLVIFLDAADPDVEQWLTDQEHVTYVVADDSWWQGQRPDDLNVRQRFAANIVRSLFTVVDGVDWIFHIDGDEIIQVDRAALAALPADTRAVRLAPLEAVSRKHWDASPTWFKPLLEEDDLHLLHILGVLDKPTNGLFFHGHIMGKSGMRPELDAWFTLHHIVDGKRRELPAAEDPRLRMLHYESHSGEDFVRKWTAILDTPALVSLRARRQTTSDAVRTLLGKPLDDDLRRRYLMRVFEATTEDDFETLRDLDLIEEIDPAEGTHRPSLLPADQRARLAELLEALGPVKKKAFRPCGPAAEVEAVLSEIGAVPKKRRRLGRR